VVPEVHQDGQQMPTVLVASGFNVRMYFNDHAPPHVHVIQGSREARIGLSPVNVLSVTVMSRSEAARARRMVSANREFLLAKWVELHG